MGRTKSTTTADPKWAAKLTRKLEQYAFWQPACSEPITDALAAIYPPRAEATGRPGLPMLPPAHIHARARRYAVKLFLSHYHHVAYEVATGQKPPKPYVLDRIPGHTHYVAPPNWPD